MEDTLGQYICTWVPPLEEQGEGGFKNAMDGRLADACSSSQASEREFIGITQSLVRLLYLWRCSSLLFDSFLGNQEGEMD